MMQEESTLKSSVWTEAELVAGMKALLEKVIQAKPAELSRLACDSG